MNSSVLYFELARHANIKSNMKRLYEQYNFNRMYG